MASKMLTVAVAAVLLGCTYAAFTSDGSSAAKSCIVNAGKKYGVTYLANGTGAGQAFIAAKKGPVAFGDEPFSGALPAGITQFPVAIGSIAIYTSAPGALALTTTQLCGIFSGKITKYTVIGRSDSSGSTTVLVNYLKKKCPGFVLKTNKNCDGTSGMVACIASTPNSIGYASCGQAVKEVKVDGKFCKIAKQAYPISYKLWAYFCAKCPNAAPARSLTKDIQNGACTPYYYYAL